MRLSIPLWFCAILLAPALAGAQTLPPFQVKGYGVHSGSEVIYHYRVINNSPTNVANPAQAVQIEIGRLSSDHEPELTGMPPVGYPRTMYDSGLRDMTAPTGWEGVESGDEEHIRHTLWWQTIEQPSSPYALLPGQTLIGLSVTRLNVNPTYLDSHFRVIAQVGLNVGTFSGLVEREDTTPPTLSVSVNPSKLWPPNNKLVSVTVTVTAKDDYDPRPEIKLESITANEPLKPENISGAAFGADDRSFSLMATRSGTNLAGRIYTITYSATDGTGNKSTATTTVTVPHDQGGGKP